MDNKIIHIVPEWPSKSQTFVKDDIEISKLVFNNVKIFPLPLRNHIIKKKIKDILKMIISAPLLLIYWNKEEFKNEYMLMKNETINFREYLLRIYKSISAIILLCSIRTEKNERTIIHVHFLSTGLDIALLAKAINPNLSIIATGHGSDVLFNKPERLAHFIESSDHIIAASEKVKTNLLNVVISRNIQTHFPIELRYCRIPNEIQMKQDLTLKFQSKCIQILTVARFHPQKGLQIALAAAKRLREKGINFAWEFIGDGPLRHELEKLLIAYELEGYVFFSGFQNRQYVKSRLIESDIFVLPSIRTVTASDGLPVAILEAMSLGVYVITSDVGGISEAIGSDRGSVIEPSDESLSGEIEKVIKRGNNNVYFTSKAIQWIKQNCQSDQEDPLYKIYQSVSKVDIA